MKLTYAPLCVMYASTIASRGVHVAVAESKRQTTRAAAGVH